MVDSHVFYLIIFITIWATFHLHYHSLLLSCLAHIGSLQTLYLSRWVTIILYKLLNFPWIILWLLVILQFWSGLRWFPQLPPLVDLGRCVLFPGDALFVLLDKAAGLAVLRGWYLIYIRELIRNLIFSILYFGNGLVLGLTRFTCALNVFLQFLLFLLLHFLLQMSHIARGFVVGERLGFVHYRGQPQTNKRII